MHLSCCTPNEQLEMLQILREGGCTRRPDLREDVTHVVVSLGLGFPSIDISTTLMALLMVFKELETKESCKGKPLYQGFQIVSFMYITG